MVAVDDGDRAHVIVVPVCECVCLLTCHVARCVLVWLVRWHGHVVVVVVVGDGGGRWRLLATVVTWWWWFVVDDGGG